MLFCDLVGSTPLGEQMDAEDYADVMFEYQERGRERSSATVGAWLTSRATASSPASVTPPRTKMMPNGAVQASFALVDMVRDMAHRRGEELGVELRCRIGIHADVAVVGRIEGRYEVSVFGSGVNLAARVQSEAGPDEILATASLIRSLRGPLCHHRGPFGDVEGHRGAGRDRAVGQPHRAAPRRRPRC